MCFRKGRKDNVVNDVGRVSCSDRFARGSLVCHLPHTARRVRIPPREERDAADLARACTLVRERNARDKLAGDENDEAVCNVDVLAKRGVRRSVSATSCSSGRPAGKLAVILAHDRKKMRVRPPCVIARTPKWQLVATLGGQCQLSRNRGYPPWIDRQINM